MTTNSIPPLSSRWFLAPLLLAIALIAAGCGCVDNDYDQPNQPPTAVAGNDQTVSVGDTVQFDSSGSFDAETPADQLAYEWSFGDGTTGTGPAPSHTYTAIGTYTVTLTVSDGEATSTDQLVVTVL